MRLARYPVNGIAILGPDDEQAVFALCYQLVQIVREFRYSTRVAFSSLRQTQAWPLLKMRICV